MKLDIKDIKQRAGLLTEIGYNKIESNPRWKSEVLTLAKEANLLSSDAKNINLETWAKDLQGNLIKFAESVLKKYGTSS